MTVLVYERQPVTVACSMCGKPVDELDAHYPHEPDCPRRAIHDPCDCVDPDCPLGHTDEPCDCDLTTHAGCCPDCSGELRR